HRGLISFGYIGHEAQEQGWGSKDMPKAFDNYTPPAALTGSMRDYRYPKGADLQGRVAGFYKWQNLRRQHGLWPFSRSTEESPSTVCAARDDAGGKIQG